MKKRLSITFEFVIGVLGVLFACIEAFLIFNFKLASPDFINMPLLISNLIFGFLNIMIAVNRIKYE